MELIGTMPQSIYSKSRFIVCCGLVLKCTISVMFPSVNLWSLGKGLRQSAAPPDSASWYLLLQPWVLLLPVCVFHLLLTNPRASVVSSSSDCHSLTTCSRNTSKSLHQYWICHLPANCLYVYVQEREETFPNYLSCFYVILHVFITPPRVRPFHQVPHYFSLHSPR